MTSARIKIDVTFETPVDSAGLTPTRFRWNLDQALSDGNAASQLTYGHCVPSSSMPGSFTYALDLQNFTDEAGDARTFDELVCLFVKNQPTSPSTTLNLKANASNGWTALLPGASDTIKLPSGAWILVHCSTASAYAVSASDKGLDIENTTGNAGSLELALLGRDN